MKRHLNAISIALILLFVGAVAPAAMGGDLPQPALSLPMIAEGPASGGDLNYWYLIVSIGTGILVVVSFFKPTPALHKQFADKEQTAELFEKLFDLVEKLDDKIDKEVKVTNSEQMHGRRELHRKVNGISCALWELSGRFPEMKKHLHRESEDA